MLAKLSLHNALQLVGWLHARARLAEASLRSLKHWSAFAREREVMMLVVDGHTSK